MSYPLQPRPAIEDGSQPLRLEYIAGPEEAGDAACWAQFVCPECGAVRSEGTCRCESPGDGADAPGSQPA